MSDRETVYFRDKNGAHFGYLISRGRVWAYVNVNGKKKQVPVGDVKQWPPPPPESVASRMRRRSK